MGEVTTSRRSKTIERIERLKGSFGDANSICGDTACAYMTGSFARGEAHEHSDLDLFILGRPSEENGPSRSLTRLDQIRVKARLIEAARSRGIPDFSGDGEFLTYYTVAQLRKHLGTPEDDSTNTFTARMLLLLESRPLVGDERVYRRGIEDVLAEYWRDYEDHSTTFVPAFIANDILRFWRTLCVNYEARTKTEPAEKKAKRKLKNFKLKHSRLLTCYSAILYLLRIHARERTVAPVDAQQMVSLSPTERLEWLQSEADFREPVEGLLSKYERFLTATDATEESLVVKLMDKGIARRWFQEANEFGDAVAALLDKVGADSPLRRLLLV